MLIPMVFWERHKGEIVAAVVGAALSAVLSMAFGMFSLTKSFEYSQNKEQLASLRKDIEYLTRVRNEIEVNTQLMVSEDYRIRAAFGKKMDLADMADKKDKATPMQKEMANAMFGGGVAPLIELHVPRHELVVESWGRTYPEGGDIAFELLADINDYYRRAKRINVTVERAKNLVPGQAFQYAFAQAFLKDIEYHNGQVGEFGKVNTVALRQKVDQEIKRLADERKKVSARVTLD
jgi:hypothetical protein